MLVPGIAGLFHIGWWGRCPPSGVDDAARSGRNWRGWWPSAGRHGRCCGWGGWVCSREQPPGLCPSNPVNSGASPGAVPDGMVSTRQGSLERCPARRLSLSSVGISGNPRDMAEAITPMTYKAPVPGASSPLPERDTHALRFHDDHDGAGRGCQPRRQGCPASRSQLPSSWVAGDTRAGGTDLS